MKRYLRICISLIILMVSTSIIILLNRKSKEFKVTALKKDYHQVYLHEEPMSLKIITYSNDKSSKYLNKELISGSYLSDAKGENSYRVFVEEIIDLDETIMIKKEKFYCFQIIINLESLLEKINIPDAILVFEYYDQIVFNLFIGWVSLYKVPRFGSLNNELAICHLKGFTTIDQGIKKLQAILVGLRNNSAQNITIDEISPLAGDVFFNDVTEISDPSITLDEDFDIYNIGKAKSIIIELSPQETKYFIVPIKYIIRKNLSSFGLEISYFKENQLYQMYFDDYIFFSNTHISKEELNQMIINSYANN